MIRAKNSIVNAQQIEHYCWRPALGVRRAQFQWSLRSLPVWHSTRRKVQEEKDVTLDGVPATYFTRNHCIVWRTKVKRGLFFYLASESYVISLNNICTITNDIVHRWSKKNFLPLSRLFPLVKGETDNESKRSILLSRLSDHRRWRHWQWDCHLDKYAEMVLGWAVLLVSKFDSHWQSTHRNEHEKEKRREILEALRCNEMKQKTKKKKKKRKTLRKQRCKMMKRGKKRKRLQEWCWRRRINK